MSTEVEKPIVVLKFGSSVLVDRTRLPDVVSEIYRVVRTGRRVVAVTSAFHGVTDDLLALSVAGGCPHDNINAPAYVATGEEASSALVALACDRSGLCAIALKAPELGILAEGSWREATPTGLRSIALLRALETHDVVVVPGFVGINRRGETVLLGRGGSDLTAVFLAHALRAERVRLVKDVDGVYDRDPASVQAAQRYHHVDWAAARRVAGKLIQDRALEFAAAQGLNVEVGTIGSDNVTLVGPLSAPAEPPERRRKLRVALAGFGVVGAGVAQRLQARPQEFEITGVLVRDPTRKREGQPLPAVFVTDPGDLLEFRPDVIVDVLSCGAAGAQLSERALSLGIDVVSANKQAIVSAHDRLVDTASENGARLLYSAAVGGGAPLLEAVRCASSEGADIVEIEGVFNGTLNYLLELLAAGASFEDALGAAQRAGLAEANPVADLSGADAAAKLQLVARLAFGAAVDTENLCIAPLDARVAEAARTTRLKQVARLVRHGDRIEGSIGFELAEAAFSDLRGDRNAIRITAADGRVWSARGRGAGRWPTTESVFADLVDLSILHAGHAAASGTVRAAETIAAAGAS